MPGYSEWNTALIEHVTASATRDSTVYLETSDDTLNRIGVQRWGVPPDDTTWRDDYLSAVRTGCVTRGRIDIEWLERREVGGQPLGVAFLGAMVLAASHMSTDLISDVHERNYFKRLAEVLNVELGSQGRPAGLPTGAEEPLWKAWVRYLQRQGHDSSARGGEGARRFIQYPISQTLIPEAEKQRLRRIFAERHYSRTWDAETLAARLRADGLPSQKLKELLARTGAAAEDVQSALFDVFQGMQAIDGTMTAAEFTRPLMCGLYRDEHWRTGEPQYRLFPKHPHGVRWTALQVHCPWGDEALKPERPGYYQPLGEVEPGAIGTGVQYVVSGSPFISTLVLPARDFWLLRADPDRQGLYASLGTPGVGESLLLLMRAAWLPDLRRFQDEGLVAWPDEPEALDDEWVEIRDLMVVGNHWSEVNAGAARPLHEALRPPGGVSIHLSGGVRLQQAGDYLVGATPHVSVQTFFGDATLTVLKSGVEVFSTSAKSGTDLDVPLQEPGTYELLAESRGLRAPPRLIHVLAWEALRAAPPAQVADGQEVNGCRILGPHVVAQ